MIVCFVRRLLAMSALLAALGIALPCAAQVDNYPSRPIRLIVPFAPGGDRHHGSIDGGSTVGTAWAARGG